MLFTTSLRMIRASGVQINACQIFQIFKIICHKTHPAYFTQIYARSRQVTHWHSKIRGSVGAALDFFLFNPKNKSELYSKIL